MKVLAFCDIDKGILKDAAGHTYIDDDDYSVDDILEDFSDATGISSNGREALGEIVPNEWEFSDDIGKTETGLLELYMLAFKLAQEQLKNKDSKLKAGDS